MRRHWASCSKNSCISSSVLSLPLAPRRTFDQPLVDRSHAFASGLLNGCARLVDASCDDGQDRAQGRDESAHDTRSVTHPEIDRIASADDHRHADD